MVIIAKDENIIHKNCWQTKQSFVKINARGVYYEGNFEKTS